MKYHIVSRVIHWLMALIILFLLGLGIYMTDFLSKEAPNRMEIYNLHKSLGVMVLILVFVRIINRFANKPPALPDSLPKFEKIAAHLAHIALYLLMILVPLSGYLMSNSFGYPVNFFSIQLPFLVQQNFELGNLFHNAHWILAYSLIAILALHILGVIKHRFFDKTENDVLKRMI
jgi:cytochrome b561